jgi:hypothetical protein
MKKIFQCVVLIFLGLISALGTENHSCQTLLSTEPNFCMGVQLVNNNRDLLLAAREGDISELNIIFSTRCYDLCTSDSYGRNILDIAVWGYHESLYSLILCKIKTGKWNRNLLEHCVHGESGLSCFAPSALHIAVLRYVDSAVQLLLDAGTRVDVDDGSGQTPLQYAIKACNEAAAKILMRANASIDHLSLGEINSLETMLDRELLFL